MIFYRQIIELLHFDEEIKQTEEVIFDIKSSTNFIRLKQ